jgi:hypothetical protein
LPDGWLDAAPELVAGLELELEVELPAEELEAPPPSGPELPDETVCCGACTCACRWLDGSTASMITVGPGAGADAGVLAGGGDDENRGRPADGVASISM